jgi:hypothetical protein
MTATTVTDVDLARALADKFIEFLKTNKVPEGLFAPDVFLDLTVPTWRIQTDSADGAVAIRVGGHPYVGEVPRHRFDPTPTGFVLEFEERWTAGGQDWYCREMIRADISAAGIKELSIYCSGDWDQAQIARHRAEVTLLRP